MQNASAPFAGAFLFESGWEFGYLWSAIAHYEACWDPHLEENDTTSATAAVLMEAGMDDHFGRGWASTFASVGSISRKPLIYGNTAYGTAKKQ